MADLPRWIDRWDVDSMAMLSAFITYHGEMRKWLEDQHGMSFQPIWEGFLWCILHKDPPHLAALGRTILPMKIPRKRCRQRDCHRCGVRGGFVFRWYSPYWAKEYNRVRRPGSWKAPEPLYVNEEAGEDYMLQHERFWQPTGWLDESD